MNNQYRLSNTMPIISVRDLHHSYSELSSEAVAGINLDVYEADIFGLIGPDGAGKTTVFQMLSGVMSQTSGLIKIFGSSPQDVRSHIGYLTQRFSLYSDMSVLENLQYAAGLREVNEADFKIRSKYFLNLLDMARFKNRLAGNLSGGMKQKLALCCTVIHKPRLMLLDEPTTGVDPISRREFWDIVVQLTTKELITTVVATPYLDEAERCTRIALIHEGKVCQCGTPNAVKSSINETRLEFYMPINQLNDAEDTLKALPKLRCMVSDVQRFGDRLDVLTTTPEKASIETQHALSQRHLKINKVVTGTPTLENIFVARLRELKGETPRSHYPRISRCEHLKGTAIGAQGLNKFFGSFHAVKDINLDIKYGEVFGLLGANGAGKTTTIKMLCGLVSTSSGKVTLAGETDHLRSAKVRQKIGYMSQKFTLYDNLTIEQNLEFYCGVYGVPLRHRQAKKKWVLQMSDLVGQGNRLTSDLPGGWKQRVAFGTALMHEPRVLFLDEPTSGVDPLARREFWRWINEFTHDGIAVLVTTHYLEEAEQCNRLGFMVSGELVTQGTPRQVKDRQTGQLVEWECQPLQAASDFLTQRFARWRVSIFGSRLHTVLDEPSTQIPLVRGWLEEIGINVHGYRKIDYTLEDVFISVVERASRQKATSPIK